ncbi:MAG: hypothetical protein GF355_04690 [Candidatus Eisenbacteria bacterium]|nr:hypothetical protein [Candidatus Eisenbacteria bacterium]
MTPGGSQIPEFGRRFFGAEETFTRIGTGEMGGKAAGLERVHGRVLPAFPADEFPQIEVAVPTLTILMTDVFAEFMELNNLYDAALSDRSDDRIAHAFQKTQFPARYIGDLRALISKVHTPLAVRSSSLLEDALAHPFAGVYGTKMIPNNQSGVDQRFNRLVEAIKFVYASTFFRGARSYRRSVGQDDRAERMAVVIQEVVGRRIDDNFYPTLSGVARSYNYYPTGHSEPEDGVVNLALGLGKQIVDGGLSWNYSPAYPQAPAPFNNVGDLIKNTQTKFWAVHMGRPPIPDPVREAEYLVERDLAAAERDSALQHLVSSYDPRSDRLRPGLGAAGPRVLDFAPLLKFGAAPLNDLIRRLLDQTEKAAGAEVEIEFAMNLHGKTALPARFGFLQARPMAVSDEEVTVAESELQAPQTIVASDLVLGNGLRDDIRDVVYVKPETFEAKLTPVIAAELEQLNRGLMRGESPYLLIGFGRWGSSDPWLGTPVEWGQICGARVMVEATLPEMNPDLSQGSHFFHNLISFKILYLSVRQHGASRIDWEWLARQPAAAEARYVRHVQTERPLRVAVDGRGGRGMVQHEQETG